MNPKYERILQLKEMGFNTPRMFYIDHNCECERKKLFNYLLAVNHQTFANIRTYKSVDEGWLSEHFTFVPLTDVLKKTMECLDNGLVCMIDVEDPHNGMFSGNVQIFNTPDEDFIAEWVHRPLGGAMVREADQHIRSNYVVAVRKPDLMPSQVLAAVRQAFNRFDMPYKSVVLEFTWGIDYCGENPDAHLVWWEYRDKEA